MSMKSTGESAPRSYFRLGTRERHQLDAQLASARRSEMEKRQEEEAVRGCLFQPRINDRTSPFGSKQTSSQPLSVFDRLREQARLRAERQERRAREQELKDASNQQNGFKPQINKKTPFDESMKHLSDVPVADRLLFYGEAVAKATQMKRDQKGREEREAAETLHRKTKHVDPRERREAQQAFNERNSRLLLQRELSRQAAEEKARQELTFQPKISATSAAIDEVAKQHNRKANTRSGTLFSSSGAAQARSVDFEDIFPSTGFRNDRLVFSEEASVDRGTLLYEQAMQRQREKADSQEKELLREQLERNGGNRPRTNPLSDVWIKHGEHQKLFQQDFVTRQALYSAAKQDELDVLTKQQLAKEEEECQRDKQEAPVTQLEIKGQVNRLYYQPLSATAMPNNGLERKRQELLAAECPFTPQLSAGTEQVLRRAAGKRETNVVKRLASTHGGKSGADNGGLGGEQDSRESPFCPNSVRRELYESTPEKPISAAAGPLKRWDTSPAQRPSQQLSTFSSEVSPRRSIAPEELAKFHQRQDRLIQLKEEKVKLLKQKELVAEMAECTFRPRTTCSPHNSDHDTKRTIDTSPAEAKISGLQQYLNRQALAKRLKEEQEERVRALGHAKCDARQHRTSSGSTIVTPFRLYTEKRHEATPRQQHEQQGDVSLFALTTAERERVLSTDYSDAYKQLTVDEEDNDCDGSDSTGGSTFDVHEAEPQPVDPCDAVSFAQQRKSASSSGGEICYPRGANRADSLRKPVPSTFPSSLLREGAREKQRDGNKSVSFIGVPDTPVATRRAEARFRDPYNVTSLLANLREKRK